MKLLSLLTFAKASLKLLEILSQKEAMFLIAQKELTNVGYASDVLNKNLMNVQLSDRMVSFDDRVLKASTLEPLSEFSNLKIRLYFKLSLNNATDSLID